jgi:predicted AAA+ superfamily ATPase
MKRNDLEKYVKKLEQRIIDLERGMKYPYEFKTPGPFGNYIERVDTRDVVEQMVDYFNLELKLTHEETKLTLEER